MAEAIEKEQEAKANPKDVIVNILGTIGSTCVGIAATIALDSIPFPGGLSRPAKAAVKAGKWIVSGMISAASYKYLSDEIGDTYDTVEEIAEKTTQLRVEARNVKLLEGQVAVD